MISARLILNIPIYHYRSEAFASWKYSLVLHANLFKEGIIPDVLISGVLTNIYRKIGDLISGLRCSEHLQVVIDGTYVSKLRMDRRDSTDKSRRRAGYVHNKQHFERNFQQNLFMLLLFYNDSLFILQHSFLVKNYRILSTNKIARYSSRVFNSLRLNSRYFYKLI